MMKLLYLSSNWTPSPLTKSPLHHSLIPPQKSSVDGYDSGIGSSPLASSIPSQPPQTLPLTNKRARQRRRKRGSSTAAQSFHGTLLRNLLLLFRYQLILVICSEDKVFHSLFKVLFFKDKVLYSLVAIKTFKHLYVNSSIL